MAELFNISVTPSCFWGSELSHIAWQCNCPGREGKACVSEAQIFVITGGGGCSCETTLFAYLQHKIPVLILKLCAIPHTNCASTLMHGNRCSLLWAMFLCDVCCDDYASVLFLVWRTCSSPERQQRKGSKMASAWPASSLMAKRGQFLLVGNFFQLCLALKEFVTSNPSFAKVCKLCYVHQTLSVCAQTSCCS